MKRFRILAAMGAIAVLSGCMPTLQVAKPGPGGTHRVSAGVPTAMEDSYLTLNEKCKSQRNPTGTIIKPPRHGTARPVIGKAHPAYGRGHAFRHCNARIRPALSFVYKSRGDYRGPDSFTARIRFGDGELRTKRYRLNVR